MKRKKTPSRLLSLAVAALLLVALLPATLLAAEGDSGNAGETTCAHVHDELCGWVEDETPCTHECDEECGGLPPQTGEGVAGEPTGEGGDEPGQAVVEITAFDALAGEVQWQGFDAGRASLADIVLPETLAATGGAADTAPEQHAALTVEGVVWQCVDAETGEPAEFDGGTEGTYTFAPAPPDGYTLAEGVALPQITVIVRPAAGMNMRHRASADGLGLDLAVGTWNGDGTNEGDGHRWIEFGGIRWRVLEVYNYAGGTDIASGANSGDRIAFLLAEDLVDARPFNSTWDAGDGNWIESDIRAWLNDTQPGGFLGDNFGGDEQAGIVESNYVLGGNQNYHHTGNGYNYGPTTGDASKVFLLSTQEAEEYFADDADRVAYLNNTGGYWWLRSPGSDASAAALVNYDGVVDGLGLNVDFAYGIRPALKINLSSGIFTSDMVSYGAEVWVKDAGGAGISGAQVSYSGAVAPGDFSYTDTSGYVQLPATAAGEYSLTVAKQGYATYEGDIALGLHTSLQTRVTLERDGSLPAAVRFGSFASSSLNWQVLSVDDSNPAAPKALLLLNDMVHTGATTPADASAWAQGTGSGQLVESGNFTTDEMNAMLTHATTGTKMFLLSESEVEQYLPSAGMRTWTNQWWLREGQQINRRYYVNGTTGVIGSYGTGITTTMYARPAVWVDLTRLMQVEDSGGNVTLTPMDTYTATVTVVDGRDNNAALQDAIVEVGVDPSGLQPGETLRPWNGTQAATDAGGQATFTLPDGDHTVTASAPGYTQGSDTLSISGGDTTKTIALYTIPKVQNLTYNGTNTSGDIVITFSEAMDATPGTVAFTGGPHTMGTDAWNGPANTEYTVAYTGLAYNTAYTVEVSGFKSANNVEMLQDNTNSFTTQKGDLTGATITVNDGPFTYNGSAYTPGVTVTLAGATVPAAEYTLSYDNNTNAGQATVTATATATGNYASTATGSFTINKADPAITWPTSATLTYGQTLAYAVLEGESGDGVFAFVNSDFAPEVADSDTSYEMAFIPDDTANYNTPANHYIKVTVLKSNELGVSAHPTASAREGVAKTFTFNLATIALDKFDTGTLTYSAAIGTDANGILSNVGTTGITLNYTVAATAAVGNTATIDITITSENYENVTVTLTITITAKDPQTIVFAQGTLAKTYGDASFTEQATLQGTGGTGAITYTSDAPAVATVNATTGEVTIVKAGTATITATKAADDDWAEATASYALVVNPKALTDSMLAVDAGPFAYAGTAQTPGITVMDGAAALALGTDYTDMDYKDNTNAGTATVSVRGTGNYTGTASGEFTIGPATLSIDGANVELEEKTYDGTPGVAVTAAALTGMVNGETLTFGQDFTATAAFDDANAGGGKTVTVEVVLNTSGPAANYTLAGGTHTLTGQAISPKTVVVRVADMEIQQGAALPTPQITYTGFVGADDETNALATSAKAKMPVQNSNEAGRWPVGFEPEAALNSTTGANYTLAHQPGTLVILAKPTQPGPITFAGLPTNNTVQVGGKFTLTPSVDGQTGSTGWKWDSDFFSATFNSPATFTALKTGTSTITYTAPDGRSVSVTLTVQAAPAAPTVSPIAKTGDSGMAWLYALLAAAAAALAGGLVWCKRRKASEE